MLFSEIAHIKSEILFYIYNLYIEGKSIEQIVHSIDMFTEWDMTFNEVNDIIDYLNEIL